MSAWREYQSTYPAWPDDERSERAKAAGVPHRYGGGRLVLIRPIDGFGVSCFRIENLDLDTEPPRYGGASLDERRVAIDEPDIVVPDPVELNSLLRDIGDRGLMPNPADFRRLLLTYVWITLASWPSDDISNDALVYFAVRSPFEAWRRVATDVDALAVWSDRARIDGQSRVPKPFGVARIPLVAACRLADGRHVVINPELSPSVTLPADEVRAMAKSAMSWFAEEPG